MTRLPDAFHQDRALRDAARDVLRADIEHARATLSGKAIANRVTGRIGDGAKDVLEVAKGHASERQGLIAGLVALVVLWFAREPIAELLGLGAGDTSGANGAKEPPLDEGPDEGENTPQPNAPDTPDNAAQSDTGEPETPATGDRP